jgi:CRISPR-associated endonuclease/helicase Cas3
LLGPWEELLASAGLAGDATRRRGGTGEPGPIEQEILALNREEFDLLAYLICAHHGKVRLAWHAGKADQEAADAVLHIRGIRDGEILPAVPLAARDGSVWELPPTRVDLSPAAAGLSPRTGASWTDRVLGLLDCFGPFALAYLEALMRAADQRASRSSVADPLLQSQNDAHELKSERPAVAEPFLAGANPPPPELHPPQGGSEHSLLEGAGKSGDAGGDAQAPAHDTRRLATTFGVLNCAGLAPHLALRVQELEAAIAEGLFAKRRLDEELIRDLHRRICGDLLPQTGGCWRRIDVRVGEHELPSYPRIPILMRDYCLDLKARLGALSGPTDERVPETLARAEGRLLWIHPFADFNGRTTRVLLAELLRRLGLPAINPTPDPGSGAERYLSSLRASDRGNWGPLTEFWIERFAKEGQP